MKKLFAIVLAFSLISALTGCAGLENVELPPFPTFPAEENVQPSEEPLAQPEPSEEPSDPEIPSSDVDYGSRVTVSIKSNSNSYYAPDNAEQLILTFGYDDITVRIEGNDAAAQAVNDYIALKNEQYYMGNSTDGSTEFGVNGMLEMAIDNYSYAQESGAEINLEFEAERMASVARADSRLISLILSDYVYSGGAHPAHGAEALVFDSETGSRLTIADICEDTEKLSSVSVEYMMAQINSADEYIGLRENEELEAGLGGLIRDGSWYLGKDGFTVFSDEYELGSYADGSYKFTVPYAELEGVIKEQYLPIEMTGEYTVDITENNLDGLEVIDKVTANADGEEFYLTVNGSIYEVKLSSVVYSSYSGIFNETAELWHCSHIKDGKIQLEALLPEGLPNLMLSFISADGEYHELLLSVSESDGCAELVSTDIVSVG